SGTSDPSGHGTWVAGIAAAQTNTTEGIAGVAYAGVRIMPVTVLDANGLGQDSDVIAGVIWAADHGADVIVMAFSNPGFSQNLQDALDYAWSKNVVLVAATGNDAVSTPTFPAGTQDQTGNGRINMARALADTGTDFVQPAGAPPVGAGGPFVGPYRAAAVNMTVDSLTASTNFSTPGLIMGSTGNSVTIKVTVTSINGNQRTKQFVVATTPSAGSALTLRVAGS